MSFSALQRAENSSIEARTGQNCGEDACFSALQRAENSSIEKRPGCSLRREEFQCSSASRKFLNSTKRRNSSENSAVSVLFSEPKIPQFAGPLSTALIARGFQCSSASRKFLNFTVPRRMMRRIDRFSALQRAENSSMPDAHPAPGGGVVFQCSSASRKFLNDMRRIARQARGRGFSALQRAENSSIR